MLHAISFKGIGMNLDHMIHRAHAGESKGGKFCEDCQSVAADPRLSKEWHPDNPPPKQVAKSSNKKFLWLCLRAGHPPYYASCLSR